MIDEQVGNIIDALERRGILDETLFIFTSDHGDSLCDHGHIQKWTMYDQSIKVPAIIAGPGVRQGMVNGLTAHFDLGPTILEAAGVAPPSWMEANSLWPVLRNVDGGTRERVFSEHAQDKILQGTSFMTMVRSDNWKLVHFADHDDGQLFDLQNDPLETKNLWNVAEHQERKHKLIAEILCWRIDSDLKTQGFRSFLAGA